MRCSEIMKSDVECIGPNETVETAARQMRDENIGFLPVCDAAGKVVGTVTDRDLCVRVLAEGRLSSTSIGDVTTREVVACSPDDDIRRAEELLVQFRKSRIMCLDNQGRLAGVISLSDLAQFERRGRVADTLRGVTEREASPTR